MRKVCTKCGVEKPMTTECFPTRKDSKDGFRNDCKECKKKNSHEYNMNNKERRKSLNKEWRKNNPEKSKLIYARYRGTEKRRVIACNWARDNREAGMKRFVERYNSDVQFNIAIKYRRRIYMAIRNQYTSKAFTTIELLGISYKELKNYLENKFTQGMTWDKVMSGEIHLDHIKPCALFDFTDEKQQQECFHYTNLQPLWAEDNMRKSAKYEASN